MTIAEKKVLTYENDFKDYIAALDSGSPVLIDSDMFFYWLEVLPPVYMNKVQTITINGVTFPKQCSFGFAEGREYIVDFWPAGDGNYWALRSNRLNRG